MTFYDDTPFDFVPPGQEEASYPESFRTFLDGIGRGERVLEIGCGTGRNLAGIRSRGHRPAGIDFSLRSAGLSRRLAPTACMDATRLGLRAGSVDVAVLDGVAHHTPDPAGCLREASRVLRTGGRLFLGVYKDSGYYPLVYNRVGGVLRHLDARAWGRGLVRGVAVPAYGLLHRLRRGARSPESVRSLFADYFLTPIATFHGREEVERWAEEAALLVQSYDPFPSGNCHFFVMTKVG